MRRVYYSFAFSMISSTALWQGVLLGASIAVFGRLTHVAAIAENMLATPVGSVPIYVVESFMKAAISGEIITVLVVFFMVTLSVLWIKRIGETILQTKLV